MRSLGLMPEFVSHDWHVQPSCQRPNRGPPERREFSPGGAAQVRIRLSSKPYKHTVRRKSRQSSVPQDFQMFSTSGKSGRGTGELTSGLKPKSKTSLRHLVVPSRSEWSSRLGVAFAPGARIRATVWPSVRVNTTSARISRRTFAQAFCDSPRRKTRN